MATEGNKKQLTAFLESIEDNNVIIKRSENEVTDICEAVEEMVDGLLSQMGDREPNFMNLKNNIIKVGSFYGRTKIKEPDEFDFLVVLDEFPADQVRLEDPPALCKFPGFRHIIIKQDSTFYDKWSKVTFEGTMVNRGASRKKRVKQIGDWHREGIPHRTIAEEGFIEVDFGLRDFFYICLHESFETLKQRGKISKTNGFLDLTTYADPFISRGSVYTFEQRRTEIEHHGPATNVNVRWTPNDNSSCCLDITVDISPAFRSHSVAENIKMEWVQHENFRSALIKQGSFLVIPTSYQCQANGLCFNIAHTETELKLVKELSETHKRCYKLLKYIMNGGTGSPPHGLSELHYRAFRNIDGNFGRKAFVVFSSFALKTIVLQHSTTCREESDLATCTIQLLERIKSELSDASCLGLENGIYIPIDLRNVFDTRQRVIIQKQNHRTVVEPCLNALNDVLSVFFQGPYEIDKLKPVNSGALLHYISNRDYSRENWAESLVFDLAKKELFENLPLPAPTEEDTDSAQEDVHVIYTRQ